MQTWQKPRAEQNLAGTGNPELLDLPMTAFFASRQCPGVAIRAAMNWALQQARLKAVVVSGFHSPLEQSVLTVLLQAKSPVVVVLARPVSEARLPSAWHEAMQAGRMAVVSREQSAERMTKVQAAERNDSAAALAQKIVIAHASPGGQLARSCEAWGKAGYEISFLCTLSD
jgi:hypothetical protein